MQGMHCSPGWLEVILKGARAVVVHSIIISGVLGGYTICGWAWHALFYPWDWEGSVRLGCVDPDPWGLNFVPETELVVAHFCISVPVFAPLPSSVCSANFAPMFAHQPQFAPTFAHRPLFALMFAIPDMAISSFALHVQKCFYPDLVIWENMILSRISKACLRRPIVYARIGF